MSMLFKRIKDWATSITAFRTGDVIAVDGPSGTAKMSKDDLLKETAENAVNSGVAASKKSVVNIDERTEDCREYGELFFAITDTNGNIGFAVDNEGNIIGLIKDSRLKELAENGFCITDKNGFIGFAVDNEGKVLQKTDDGRIVPSFVLPKKVPCVVGRPHYLYYDAIIKNGWLDAGLHVGAMKYNNPAMVRNESASGDMAVDWPLNTSDGKTLDTGIFTLKILAKSIAGSFKICVCGDSKTENASKLAQLLNICDWDGNLSVTLLGTRTSNYKDASGNTRSVKHEGYSGRSVINLCQSATLGTYTNIFYDSDIAGDNKFSFAKGVTALGDVPDILWIDHGANQRSADKDVVLGCYEAIIQSVKDYNTANSTDVKVVISVQEFGGCRPLLVGNSQGKSALNGTNVPVEFYIQNFEGRENEGVFICPQYLCIDPWNDYPMAKTPSSINIGDPAERLVSLDNVHPGMNLPNYSSTTTYNFGDSVKVSAGVGAVCIVENVVGVDPSTDDGTHWRLTTASNINCGYFKISEMYYSTIKYMASL